MSKSSNHGSGEYSPTHSIKLPLLSRNSNGFICPSCGHIEESLEENFYQNMCPMCVITALKRLNVPTMMTISEFHKDLDEALEPTDKIDNSNKDNKPSHDKTTEIYRIRK